MLTLNVLKPSVNNMTVRVFLRAAGLGKVLHRRHGGQAGRRLHRTRRRRAGLHRICEEPAGAAGVA